MTPKDAYLEKKHTYYNDRITSTLKARCHAEKTGKTNKEMQKAHET